VWPIGAKAKGKSGFAQRKELKSVDFHVRVPNARKGIGGDFRTSNSRVFLLARATRSGCRTAGAPPALAGNPLPRVFIGAGHAKRLRHRGCLAGVGRKLNPARFYWRGPREAAAAPQVLE